MEGPYHSFQSVLEFSTLKAIDTIFATIDEVLTGPLDNLLKAQKRMKENDDNHIK